jgi:hypothetical protein
MAHGVALAGSQQRYGWLRETDLLPGTTVHIARIPNGQCRLDKKGLRAGAERTL